MKHYKRFIVFSMLLIFSFVVVGCGETTTEATTAGETTTAVTTEAPVTTTDGGTTADVTTADVTTADVTTEPATTTETITTTDLGQAPQFVGLFNAQTYYIGSRDFNLLEGVVAVDTEDGDITEDIRLIGWSPTMLTRTGPYVIYATVEDSAGNKIIEEISLTVKELSDFTIPETLTTDPIEITLWHSNGDTVSAAMEKYAADFKSNFYSNITVNIVHNADNYDQLRVNVVNAINNGILPNIVQNYPDHVMEYTEKNALITLTPYIYHPVYGYSTTVEEESFTDIVLSYRRENSQYTIDGEYYSVPFNKSTEVMIYNKDMFDVLMADGVIDEVPNTWQGLFAIADELKAAAPGVIDNIAAIRNLSSTPALNLSPEDVTNIKTNFVPITYDSPGNAFITLTRQWGGEYTGIDAQREGLILFDNQFTRNMLSYFFDNRDTNFTVPAKWSYEYGSDAFLDGQTAVTFGSTGGARYNTPDYIDTDNDGKGDTPTFEYGVAPMPYNADMPEERTAIQQGTNMSLTDTGSDQEKLASWLFLKYLTSAEVQLHFALTTGYSPVRYTVYDDPAFIQFTNGLDTDGTQLIDEDLMKSRAANAAAMQSDFLFYDQAFIGSSKAREEVEAAFERVILGSLEGTTKEDIIDDAIAAAKSNSERVL